MEMHAHTHEAGPPYFPPNDLQKSATHLFPPGHPLASLTKPSFRSIREALCSVDISMEWNDSLYDPRREAFRPNPDRLFGEGTRLVMPQAACYLSSPGRNGIFLPHLSDRSVTAYFQRYGFVGDDVFYIKSLEEIKQTALERGRKVYSIDDLPDDFDDISVNSARTVRMLNSKAFVSELSAYAPHEFRGDLREGASPLVSKILEFLQEGTVYVKTSDTESAGRGVFRVESELEAITVINDSIKRFHATPGLQSVVIIQPAIKGVNKSFQVLITDEWRSNLQVVALTDQLVGQNGVTYAGSVNHEVTADRLERIGPAIIDMVERIQAKCPDARGFLMCDYFERPDGSVVLFDPGLRPSGNTAGAMAKLWVESVTGSTLSIKNRVPLEVSEPGLPWLKLCERLGKYSSPDSIVTEGRGVLLQGYNHLASKARLIVVTRTPDEQASFIRELQERAQKG